MEPVNKGRMDLWKTQLTSLEVKIADQIAGKTADAMGYKRLSTSFSPAVFFKALPMSVYGRILFRLMQWGSLLPYRSSRWIALSLPKLARLYGRFAGKKGPKDQEKR
jgi:hypothetical protein